MLVPIFSLCSLARSANADAGDDSGLRLHPELEEELEAAGPSELFDVIVHVAGSVELNAASLPKDRFGRRAAVIERLRQAASSSQADLIRQLHLLESAGHVADFRPLWIVNGVLVRGNSQAIKAVAARPDVTRVTSDTARKFVDPVDVWPAGVSVGIPWGLERIRAVHVWEGLGVTGQGVTIAVFDTGVDWHHPSLHDNYRGSLGAGTINHVFNWYDPVQGSPVPVDPHGHGTHVAGTAVGQDSIGVAPGAKWIAARILDENGFGTVGNIHLAFQWILAPGGDPAQSPDIVNNSWGGASELVDFIPDLAALRAAGIIAVFSAGNNGPSAGTVGAPASYPDSIAVGASDDMDTVAWFSSRGPSPLTSEPKPTLIAPGARILSAKPGAGYAYASGTSMAAPHVAGAFALLLSADPSMDQLEATAVLTHTARPITVSHPNGNSGWGRLDAYGAVSQIASAGLLEGIISAQGAPLPGAALTLTTPSGTQLAFTAGADGRYEAALQTGVYQAEAGHFGYFTSTSGNLTVTLGMTTVYNINLSRRPHGSVSGHLLRAGTLNGLAGRVRVAGTPIVATAGSDGHYTLQLPVGRYELIAERLGFRLARQTVAVSEGSTVLLNFQLEAGPKVLLLDSGQWYYQSQASYFELALEDNDYAYELWPVRNPLSDAPTSADLGQYDAVVWSSPLDSPGEIGADDALADYLEGGGNLLISGQNLAGQGQSPLDPQYWWYRQLGGTYLGKEESPTAVAGSPGTPFDGVELLLNGEDSAGNQVATDQVAPHRDSLAEVAFTYPEGQGAALQAGQCEAFRIVYLGFGLEGVTGSGNRADVARRGFDYFSLPETQIGLRFLPDTIDDLGAPGMTLTYTIELRNFSETLTDTFQLSLANNQWPAALITSTVTLGPCQEGLTRLTVSIPSPLPADTVEQFTLRATSANDPTWSEQLPVRLKTPAHILLVDDDRWYDQKSTYQAALNEAGFRYDFWETGTWPNERGSPTEELLNGYDIVVWYTGYDWFKPITAEESEALHGYVSQGGRLFLTSQDYLYYHGTDLLTRDYLGVREFSEPVTPTKVFGGDAAALWNSMPGPITLEYGPYQNFSDGLIPAPGAEVSLWHNQGMAGGVALTGRQWRTTFWAIPFETLPAEYRSIAINRIVGWLSDLGGTTFESDSLTGPSSGPDAVRTYTLTLRNIDAGIANQVYVTNTVPGQLGINPSTITGGAVHDPATGKLTWKGWLKSGEAHTISYQATPVDGLPAGTRIDNTVRIRYVRHELSFEQGSPYWIDAPDLGPSSLAVSPTTAFPGDWVSYQARIVNRGSGTGPFTVTIRVPDALNPVDASLASTAGTATMQGNRVRWLGDVPTGQPVTVTLALTSPWSTLPQWLGATAVFSDGVTAPRVRDVLLIHTPYQSYFPAIAKR